MTCGPSLTGPVLQRDACGARIDGSSSIMVLPAPLVPLSEVALMDEAAVALGQNLGVLMENAGAVLAKEAQRMAGEGTVLVACGPSNNGGDGYVCARLLALAGRKVQVWAVAPPRSELCIEQARRLPPAVGILAGAPGGRPGPAVRA